MLRKIAIGLAAAAIGLAGLTLNVSARPGGGGHGGGGMHGGGFAKVGGPQGGVKHRHWGSRGRGGYYSYGYSPVAPAGGGHPRAVSGCAAAVTGTARRTGTAMDGVIAITPGALLACTAAGGACAKRQRPKRLSGTWRRRAAMRGCGASRRTKTSPQFFKTFELRAECKRAAVFAKHLYLPGIRQESLFATSLCSSPVKQP
jgi:hypothetical protein